jgi:DnaJ-class molecular chaperone
MAGRNMFKCSECHGMKVCSVCNGDGRVIGDQQIVDCTACNGTGECDACNGIGYDRVIYESKVHSSK